MRQTCHFSIRITFHGSPLRRITEAQARALEQQLVAQGEDAKVYIGMRYWYPFTEDALARIKNDGIEQLIILPLYPQFSISTSGSSFRLYIFDIGQMVCCSLFF